MNSLKIVFFFFVLAGPVLCDSLPGPKAYHSGVALYQEGKWEESIAQFNEDVRLDPGDWRAFQVMGYAYDQEKRYGEAMSACQRSLKIHPENPALRDYVEKTIRPQLEQAGPEPPMAPTSPSVHNSLYASLGTGTPSFASEFTMGWNTGFQGRLGYGFGLTPSFSLILDARLSNFPLNQDYFGLPFLTITGGGLHFLTFLASAKLAFTAPDDPVVFYGILGSGPTIVLADGIDGLPGTSQTDYSLLFGLGVDIRLDSQWSLTVESDGLLVFVPQSPYYYYYYETDNDFVDLLSVGIKWDN